MRGNDEFCASRPGPACEHGAGTEGTWPEPMSTTCRRLDGSGSSVHAAFGLSAPFRLYARKGAAHAFTFCMLQCGIDESREPSHLEEVEQNVIGFETQFPIVGRA